MDIPALSIAMSQSQLMTDVSTAILAKTMDQSEQTSVSLTNMLEQSVNPHVGQTIDIKL